LKLINQILWRNKLQEFGISIFFIILSYVLYKCIPEIKIFLKKDKNINNYYSNNNQQLKDNNEKLNLEKKDENFEDAEIKMDRLFVEPDIQDLLEKNFSSLGKERKCKE